MTKITAPEKFRQFSSFFLDETLCGIDITIVQEINEDLIFTPVPLAPAYVLGIMNLRGKIVTVIDQSRKIGFRPSVLSKESRVIIVSSQGEDIGLLVDRINEVVPATSDEIKEPPSNINGVQGKYFSGIIHTENNELLALLNIDAVLEEE